MNEKDLSRILLSTPSLLALATTASSDGTTWVQLAKTGRFHSARYGEFSITRDDLRQMAHNFRHVTPKAPTELPIDYDHLSMDPKKPGDGIAAGWLKAVELRKDGAELWGLVEWTPPAATQIANKEYRYISPSFVKDHTHKDGKKIGTTLLAAAITNHPFLEGMSAVTLLSVAQANAMHLSDDLRRQHVALETVVSCAELGQRVGFVTDAERTPELTAEERGRTFVVKSTTGLGDEQFVRLATFDGDEFGWFRVTQLAPAPPKPDQTVSTLAEVQSMSTDMKTADIHALAERFEQRVISLAKGRTAREAVELAAVQDAAGAAAYRLRGVDVETTDEAQPAPLNLSVQDGESFDALCLRYSTEKGIPLRQAVHEVGKARPELAAAR
jgi:hypothetical protein